MEMDQVMIIIQKNILIVDIVVVDQIFLSTLELEWDTVGQWDIVMDGHIIVILLMAGVTLTMAGDILHMAGDTHTTEEVTGQDTITVIGMVTGMATTMVVDIMVEVILTMVILHDINLVVVEPVVVQSQDLVQLDPEAQGNQDQMEIGLLLVMKELNLIKMMQGQELQIGR